MTAVEELYMTNRDEWREWLQNNYDARAEVWLIFFKKQTGKPSISYDDAVEEALCFGWIDSIIKRIDEDKFARKFTRRKSKSKWSNVNKERARKMIREGRMREPGLSQVREAKESGEWFSTVSRPKELEVPEFMKEALASNEKASRNFDNMAKSYKELYVRWIMAGKRDETRKRRLAEAIELLERNEKLGMK